MPKPAKKDDATASAPAFEDALAQLEELVEEMIMEQVLE
jgi:exonuclease VII small subunit